MTDNVARPPASGPTPTPLLIDRDRMRTRIMADPDVDTEAGVLLPVIEDVGHPCPDCGKEMALAKPDTGLYLCGNIDCPPVPPSSSLGVATATAEQKQEHQEKTENFQPQVQVPSRDATVLQGIATLRRLGELAPDIAPDTSGGDGTQFTHGYYSLTDRHAAAQALSLVEHGQLGRLATAWEHERAASSRLWKAACRLAAKYAFGPKAGRADYGSWIAASEFTELREAIGLTASEAEAESTSLTYTGLVWREVLERNVTVSLEFAEHDLSSDPPDAARALPLVCEALSECRRLLRATDYLARAHMTSPTHGSPIPPMVTPEDLEASGMVRSGFVDALALYVGGLGRKLTPAEYSEMLGRWASPPGGGATREPPCQWTQNGTDWPCVLEANHIERHKFVRPRSPVEADAPEEATPEPIDPRLTAVGVRKIDATGPGLRMELEIAQEVLGTLAQAATALIDHTGAENYCEMQFRHPAQPEMVTLTIQRFLGKTPHQKRQDAEAALAESRARVSRLEATVAELTEAGEQRAAWLIEQCAETVKERTARLSAEQERDALRSVIENMLMLWDMGHVVPASHSTKGVMRDQIDECYDAARRTPPSGSVAP